MAMIFHDACPICHALIAVSVGGLVTCPHCENVLHISSSDPGGHYIGEIDPDVDDPCFGIFSYNLHPPGTTVCIKCGQIYPASFECCPKLVDLAFAAYDHPEQSWSPNTQTRIAAFLRERVKVVENTAQLRLREGRYGRRRAKAADQIRHCLELLGLSHIVASS